MTNQITHCNTSLFILQILDQSVILLVSEMKDSLESWVVAAACSVVYLLAPWPMRLGGQLFVSMLEHYDAGRKEASLPFALAYLTRSISGPFAGYFGEKFGLQTVTLTGALLCAVGVGGCYFADTIVVVDILLGGIFGVGLGWATAVIPEIINHHFMKHRAKAMGLVFWASGLGAFVTPPLLAYIMDTYGMSGTFLIMSAILLHGVPFSMLLTEARSDADKHHLRTTSCSDPSHKSLPSDSLKAIDLSEPSNEVLSILNEERMSEPSNEVLSILNDERIFEPFNEVLSILKEERISEPSNEVLTILNEERVSEPFNKVLSILNKEIISDDMFCRPIRSIEEQTKTNKVPFQACDFELSCDTVKKQDESIAMICTENFSNRHKAASSATKMSQSSNSSSAVNVLWNRDFLLATTVSSTHFYVQYMYWTIIVDVGRDKGCDKHQEVYLVMTLSLLDMLGRFSLGWITDSRRMSSANFCAICFALMGILSAILVCVPGFLPTLIVTALLGLVIGGNTTGLPGLVTEMFEGERRSMAMASRLIMYAPMSLTMSPLIGYFRGQLGSYDGLLFLLTSVCAACCLLLLLVPASSDCKKKTLYRGVES